MTCRHCGARLDLVLVDLGSAPPSNAYLSEAQLREPEQAYPLKVLVCERCWLVQTADVAHAEAFFDEAYAYFSGFSATWLDHVERYVSDMVGRFGLDRNSHVVEVAANDGSLLQFVYAREIPCTGIEPTASTAAAARAKGIPVIEEFFGERLAEDLAATRQADLIAANNVLAHVPDINDFVRGFTVLLGPDGVATFEFAHVLRLVSETQFDTIYHEHFSYLSLTAVARIFAVNGLQVFDVNELDVHGGSLRVFAQRDDTGRRGRDPRVDAMLQRERAAGIADAAFYAGFQQRAEQAKNAFLRFLLDAADRGERVAGYGAAAKGNTLLNFAGVRPDLLSFVADANPAKQGTYLPGSRIPIVSEARLRDARPDYVVILPWNLRAEVTRQLAYIRAWNGRFVTAIPRTQVHP